jgi:dTMP kinase
MFITFEGCEGCGKSFQSRALFNYLTGMNVPVVSTSDPGGTQLGKELERLMKQKQHDAISAEVELFLFNVCRIHLVKEVISPSLQQNKIVVCDRFIDSTLAYQGYGRGIDLTTIKTLHNIATGGMKPDFTILLDIPVDRGLQRKNTKQRDRFEEEELTFHNRVRNGYLKMAAEEPERWFVVDALQRAEEITEIIREKVNSLLNIHRDI